MKFLSQIVTAASGSVGGLTASHNRGGLYFRGRAVPVNPASPAQVLLRSSAASATQRWSSVLTPSQRDGWDLYGQNVQVTDSLGATRTLSGVNHYVRSNAFRGYLAASLGVAAPFVDDPPTTFALGITPVLTGPVINFAVGPPDTNTFEVTIENAVDYAADDLIAVFLSPPVGQGINFFAGPYILAGTGDALTSPASIVITSEPDATPIDPYEGRYGTPAAGAKLFGYARVTHSDGRLSSRSRFGPVIFPAQA